MFFSMLDETSILALFDVRHTYLRVHIFPDFRCFSLSNFNSRNVKGINHILHLFHIRSWSSSQSQDTKVRVMGCYVGDNRGIGVVASGFVSLV